MKKNIFIVGTNQQDSLYVLHGYVTSLDDLKASPFSLHVEERRILVDENPVAEIDLNPENPIIIMAIDIGLARVKNYLAGKNFLDTVYTSPTRLLDDFLIINMPSACVVGSIFNTSIGHVFGFGNMMRDSRGVRKGKQFIESRIGSKTAYIIESEGMHLSLNEEMFIWGELSDSVNKFYKDYLSVSSVPHFAGLKLNENGQVESFIRRYDIKI